MPGKKILVIDADVASQKFVASHFLDQKDVVIQAGSGKEGLIYAWRDHPDLAVIDPTIADITGEELAKKLKQDSRTANMPLIALSGDPSAARVKSCLDAGFNDYIPKSGQAMSRLMEAANRLMGGAGMISKQGGLLLVFQSAKGGTGTSSICANIAMSIGHNHPEARVMVVDMVLPIGSIASIVGYQGPHNIIAIADMPSEGATPNFFRDAFPQVGSWHFNLLAGSPDPESSNHLKAARIGDIISVLKDSYDYVLVDIGRSLSRITMPVILNADVNMLVVSSDVSAVSITKTVADYMRGKGVGADSIYVILNRVVGLEGLSKMDVERELEIPIRAALPYLGSNMSLANSQHQPFSLKFPKDAASLVFTDAAQEMTNLARTLRAK